MKRYVHGSEDSLDVDVIYLVEKQPSFQEAKMFCADKQENRNIATIQDGVINWCFKGTIDELNNGLRATYGLHPQTEPLLLTKDVERDVLLKVIRVVRCLLSHLSRTAYRTQVKEALKSPSWAHKLTTLSSIPFQEITDFGSKGNKEDILKVFAFQLGQSLALVEGVELFTKSSVAAYYPALQPYLYRQVGADVADLYTYISLFLQKVQAFEVHETENGVYFTHFDTLIDLKTESVLQKNVSK